jgi:tRNA pseudouridine32 synthase/23S rRNA pseudouridine746 synthase/23S rRNA pseudouridine1911/1915/1917 synthase
MEPFTNKHLPRGVMILHEDRDILVVNKPAGLLTMGTEKDKVNTLYYALTDYVRKGNAKSHNRIFIVHRLDREVSGVLVFAKTEAAKFNLQDQWDSSEKTYLAVVHGEMEEKEGVITSYLAENSVFVVYSTKDTRYGKLSQTAYKVLRETRLYSLLEIRLLTGRKHQIRVHLAELSHPIVGDRKYGKGDRDQKQMALHAVSLTFNHPHTGRSMTFEYKAPAFFNRLLGGVSGEERIK